MSSNVLEFCGLTDDSFGMDIDYELETPQFVVSEEARQIFTAEEIVQRSELTRKWFTNFPKKPHFRWSRTEAVPKRRCAVSAS